MTDTRAANAVLPSDRRSFLGSSLAFAGAIAASATAPVVATAAEHPDAELLDLGAQLLAAEARRIAFDEQFEAAYELYEEPAVPEALFFKDSDQDYVCYTVERCAEHLVEGRWRKAYEDLNPLSLWAQSYIREGEAYTNRWFTAAHRARTREIAEAFSALEVARQRAEDNAGMTAPSEAARRESELTEDLRFRIASTPAYTLDGVCMKARAAAFAWSDDPSWGEKEYLPGLLAKWSTTHEASDHFHTCSRE